MESKEKNLSSQEMSPSPALVQKIVNGFYTHIPDGKDYLTQRLTDLSQYRHFFSLAELPDENLGDHMRYTKRYLEGSGDHHAFEWITFHPNLNQEQIQQINEEIKLQLDSHAITPVSAGEVCESAGTYLFDRLVHFANERGINESNNVIIIGDMDDLSPENLGKFMYDLYIWPDNPMRLLRAKIILYVPAEVDYIIQTADIPAMAHKGGIRNTLDRVNYQMIYEKNQKTANSL